MSQESIDWHDTTLLETINEMVKPNDMLWILGDFCWGGVEKACQYRKRIRCNSVNLVRGNHDIRGLEQVFAQVIDQGIIHVHDQRIWLNHYPMRSWNGSYHGTWHLYGHVHGRLMWEDQAKPWLLVRDVGVDACGYRPVNYDSLCSYMAPRIEVFREKRGQSPLGNDDCLLV